MTEDTKKFYEKIFRNIISKNVIDPLEESKFLHFIRLKKIEPDDTEKMLLLENSSPTLKQKLLNLFNNNNNQFFYFFLKIIFNFKYFLI
jgi:hypothetical protein